jgi:hypothetical protein
MLTQSLRYIYIIFNKIGQIYYPASAPTGKNVGTMRQEGKYDDRSMVNYHWLSCRQRPQEAEAMAEPNTRSPPLINHFSSFSMTRAPELRNPFLKQDLQKVSFKIIFKILKINILKNTAIKTALF